MGIGIYFSQRVILAFSSGWGDIGRFLSSRHNIRAWTAFEERAIAAGTAAPKSDWSEGVLFLDFLSINYSYLVDDCVELEPRALLSLRDLLSGESR